ncbi:E4 ORF2 [bat adenovirus 10]|uniref:E4 ORF2 n=1 Tax=bat adenovirus 10 TaxID=3070193 RepID=A0A1X9RIX7_9ADEN|nr:E4 ORF2 [Bat mastadenovirus WIV18]ARQ79798.1 E4 ORF2 [bat adenovirus 10]
MNCCLLWKVEIQGEILKFMQHDTYAIGLKSVETELYLHTYRYLEENFRRANGYVGLTLVRSNKKHLVYILSMAACDHRFNDAEDSAHPAAFASLAKRSLLSFFRLTAGSCGFAYNSETIAQDLQITPVNNLFALK